MYAKVKLSAAVIGTLLFTVAPAITHADTQQSPDATAGGGRPALAAAVTGERITTATNPDSRA